MVFGIPVAQSARPCVCLGGRATNGGGCVIRKRLEKKEAELRWWSSRLCSEGNGK